MTHKGGAAAETGGAGGGCELRRGLTEVVVRCCCLRSSFFQQYFDEGIVKKLLGIEINSNDSLGMKFLGDGSGGFNGVWWWSTASCSRFLLVFLAKLKVEEGGGG